MADHFVSFIICYTLFLHDLYSCNVLSCHQYKQTVWFKMCPVKLQCSNVQCGFSNKKDNNVTNLTQKQMLKKNEIMSKQKPFYTLNNVTEQCVHLVSSIALCVHCSGRGFFQRPMLMFMLWEQVGQWEIYNIMISQFFKFAFHKIQQSNNITNVISFNIY